MDRFIGQIDTDVTGVWQITTLCLVAQMMNGVFVLITNVNVPCLCKHTHARFEDHMFKICLLRWSQFCTRGSVSEENVAVCSAVVNNGLDS